METDHDPLPPPSPSAPDAARFVPMTAEQFESARRRKILIWSAVALVPVLIAGFFYWKLSTPVATGVSFDQAIRLFNGGKYDEALQVANTAIRRGERLAEARLLRAKIYRIKNLAADAIPDFEAALAANPDDLSSRRALAESYRDAGRIDQAISEYGRILAQTQAAWAYNGRGVCYRDQGKLREAIADFSKAVQLEEKPENVLQRGMAYQAAGELRLALADFNRVIELRPEMPYTYRARASVEEALGEGAKARADRDHARSIEVPPSVTAKKEPPKLDETAESER